MLSTPGISVTWSTHDSGHRPSCQCAAMTGVELPIPPASNTLVVDLPTTELLARLLLKPPLSEMEDYMLQSRTYLLALLTAASVAACADIPSAHPTAADSAGWADVSSGADSGGGQWDSQSSWDVSNASDSGSQDSSQGAPDVGSDVGGDAGPDASPEVVETPPTNPFVMVEADPWSTFAVDVDTASYDIFRQHVNAGLLPKPETVRLEEFVNAFDYDYLKPDPNDGFNHPFALSVEAAPSPFSATTLMRIGIRGEDFADRQQPANITWLIDVSGSMGSPNKLELIKKFAKWALEVLPNGSKMSIVTYAGSTRVALAPTTSHTAIAETFDGMSAGGSTAGGSGIDLAYEQAQAGFLENGTNVVILCSDGDFNVGPYSTTDLVELIEEKRQSGVMLSVYGFGMSNLNDQMFEAVSNAGNGTYAVISDEDQAYDYAHNNLLQNITYVAQDVKVQVAFNPDHVLAYRLLGYENRALADFQFTDDRVDAGEIGADHRVTALYELVLADGAVPEVPGAPPVEDTSPEGNEDLEPAPEGSLVHVRLRYKQVGASIGDAAEQVDYMLLPGLLGGEFADASEDFRWSAALAGWAEILKNSPYAPFGDTALISSIAADSAGDAGDRHEFITLLTQALAMDEFDGQ